MTPDKPAGGVRALVFNPWSPLVFAMLPFVLILVGPAGASSRVIQRFDTVTGRWKDITPMHPMAPYAWAMVAIGLALWVHWVFRVHRAADPNATNATPARNAALLNLVPVYNLVWVCTWPSSLVLSRVGPDAKVSTAATKTLGCIGLLFISLSLLPPGAVLLAALGLALLTVGAGLLARQLRGSTP